MSKTLAIVPTFLADPRHVEPVVVTLETLRRVEPNLDVLVVDDGSPYGVLVDEIEAATSRLKMEHVRQPENAGFSTTVNVGLAHAEAEGRNAVLVNADMEFSEPFVARMEAQRTWDGESEASVVGGLLTYGNGLIQHAGIFFSLLHRTFGHIYQFAPPNLPEAHRARRCPVTGALQFIRHDALQDVGLYDEDFTMGYEDVDYCVRVFLSGRECVYQPLVRATHHESLFRGQGSEKLERWKAESWMTFMQKWSKQSFAEWVPSLI